LIKSLKNRVKLPCDIGRLEQHIKNRASYVSRKNSPQQFL